MSPKPPKRKAIVIRTDDGDACMEVFSMQYVGDGKIAMEGKALGSMYMDFFISAEDVAEGYSLIDKKALMTFAKQLPKAIRAAKKAAKAAQAAKAE